MGKSIRRHHHQGRKEKVKTERNDEIVTNQPKFSSCKDCGNPRRHKYKTKIEKGVDQNGNEGRTRKRRAFSKKDRVTKKELMETLEFELEVDDYETT